MTVKEQLLSIFEKEKGTYFSGETLAEQLSVSRNAIWKAVNSLKKDGYPIASDAKLGYSLATDADVLSASGIKRYLKTKGLTLDVHAQIDSTNAYGRILAERGTPEGWIVIAAEQTKGRGRRGRDFYSPSGTGVYLSFLLRPKACTSEEAAHITTMAAVAVCEAIEDVSQKDASIKWVNDIYVEGKKVCGILTEASFRLEDASLDYAILGIGVNLYAPEGGFPKKIQDVAGAIFDAPIADGKNQIVANIIDHFYSYYKDFKRFSYVEHYRRRCFVIGMQIRVITPNSETTAKAIGLDDDCHLIVEYEDGRREALSSGEISIRF